MFQEREQALLFVLEEGAICRRAQRIWRVASVLAGAALGLLGWFVAAALAFAFFQFLAYATKRHSMRNMERGTGMTIPMVQAMLQAHVDESKKTTRSFTPYLDSR